MGHKKQKPSGAGILGTLWMPAVALFVVARVGFGVNKVRNASELISDPPVTNSIPATVVQINPKNVTYELFGDLGNGGRVSYANLDGEPVDVVLTSLPWSFSETTTSSAASLSLVSQVEGSSLGCRIRVNGEVRDEHVVDHHGAAVACTVTAA